ncbi:MAG TPA: hypothetical protein DEB40_12935 [Elusimicrobia bacterium]|nr:hypothetical protein [Elusimicrobiota bacterium]HBT62639.1 hypothetical protein [Elusimicrobiota bacterium]
MLGFIKRKAPLAACLALIAIGVPVQEVAAQESLEDSYEFLTLETQVVTASRRQETLRDAPVTVEVITREDIRASGASNVWDLLRFRAGMDVLEGRAQDSSKAIVSVRGFPQEKVSSLQVLLDGRSVYTPYMAGTYWADIPVSLGDIERIEIVRGPNSALYGSNSSLGVINIMTRKPAEKNQLEVSAGRGTLETNTYARVERAAAGQGWSLSHSYGMFDGFDTVYGQNGNDSVQRNVGNFRGYWKPSGRTSLEAFSGAIWTNAEAVHSLRSTDKISQDFQMLKWNHELGRGWSYEVDGSRNDRTETILPTRAGADFIRNYSYQAEGVLRGNWLDGAYQASAGAGYTYFSAESAQIFVGKGQQKSKIWRGFTHQSVRPVAPLVLSAAVSLEDSDLGGTQPAYQASAVYNPSVFFGLRALHARASTLPAFFRKSANFQPSAGVKVEGNSGLKPQKIRSTEIGLFSELLDRRLEGQVNLYYMSVFDMENTIVTHLPPPPPMVFSYDNANAAIARGLEAALKLHLRGKGSVSANYTREQITDAKGSAAVFRATPRHKFNLGGQALLGRGFSFSFNAGYKDGYLAYSDSRSQSLDIPAYWRLDARLSYVYKELELFVSGQNLLKQTHREFADGLGVPQSIFGGCSCRFGSR